MTAKRRHSTGYDCVPNDNNFNTEFEAEFIPAYQRRLSKDDAVMTSSAVMGVLFRLDWDRWIMMGLIGFLTGLIGFLLHQFIGIITQYKWFIARQLVEVRV